MFLKDGGESVIQTMQYTLQDVTKLLNLPEKTINRWIQEQQIPYHQVRGQYRFNRDELLEWAIARGIQIAKDPFQESNGKSLPCLRLDRSLQAGGIFFEIEGASKEGLLHAVLEEMNLPAEIDREFLLQMILAREELSSTAVGDGIAIPHVRSPIVLQVSVPMITLCFLKTPIEYGALDGKPVNTLFTLISPTTRTHLQLLSRLAFALRDPQFRRVIKNQGRPEEILVEAERIEANFPSSKVSASNPSPTPAHSQQ